MYSTRPGNCGRPQGQTFVNLCVSRIFPYDRGRGKSAVDLLARSLRAFLAEAGRMGVGDRTPRDANKPENRRLNTKTNTKTSTRTS
jgi:hypothetical protein